QKEPGLLLQFKKVLIQKAHAQGRVLMQSDLTDDAVFELIRTSAYMRSLATDEIVRRNYLPLRPTREEIEREQNSTIRQQMEMQADAPAPTIDNIPDRKSVGNKTQNPQLPQGLQGMPTIDPGDLNSLPTVKTQDLPALLMASNKQGIGDSSAPHIPQFEMPDTNAAL